MSIDALNIRAALNDAPPVLDFVLPGLTPGSVGTIVGAGGVGKTTLLMQVATALSTNAPAAGGAFAPAGEPRRVVLVAAEESTDILTIRLHAINNWLKKELGQASLFETDAHESRIGLMEKNLRLVPAAGSSVQLLKDGESTEFFESLCEFCQGSRLIIIDPLRRLHDGDENSSAAMTQIVQLLECLAKRTGAAVIAVHHVSKAAMLGGVGDSAAAARGSSALTDAVRWQLNLSGMSEDESKKFGLTGQHKSFLRLEFAKANYVAPQPTIWLRRLEGGVLTRVDLTDDSATAKSAARRMKQGLRAKEGKIHV
jgi:RecA-family ATPase